MKKLSTLRSYFIGLALLAGVHAVLGQPALSIAPAGNQSVIYWPAIPSPNITLLQSTTNLTTPDWVTPVYYTDAGLTQVYKTGEVTPYVNWGANGFRLPTEAEWEKTARGGLSGKRFPWGNRIGEKQANYYGDTNNYSYDLGPNGDNATGSIGGTSPATSPVGSFDVNGYGLYDMAGNVFEWCWDWYGGTPYMAGSPYLGGSNPQGVGPGSGYRVLRGGDWGSLAFVARCAFRYGVLPSLAYDYFGFRCVRGL